MRGRPPSGSGSELAKAVGGTTESLNGGEDATPTGCSRSVYGTTGGRGMGASRRTTGPFAVKDHGRLVADTQAGAEEGGLKRAVGALDLTALGIGAVIGTGIFVVIGEGIGDAGQRVPRE